MHNKISFNILSVKDALGAGSLSNRFEEFKNLKQILSGIINLYTISYKCPIIIHRVNDLWHHYQYRRLDKLN